MQESNLNAILEEMEDDLKDLEERLDAANKIIAAYNRLFLSMDRETLQSIADQDPTFLNLAKEAIQ